VDLAASAFSAHEHFSPNPKGSGSKPLRNIPNYVIIPKDPNSYQSRCENLNSRKAYNYCDELKS